MTAHLPRFVVPGEYAVGDRLELPPDEAAHARVRRLRRGDEVALLDGHGQSCLARVDAIAARAVSVEITAVGAPREHESPLRLTLAIGLLKSERIEWLIEKATELGVTRIQPFASTHTLGQPSAARRARWQLIAAGAAKQCGRSAIPEIAAPVPFATLLTEPVALRVVLTERAADADLLRAPLRAPASLQLIVGAEGGFTDAEIDAVRAAGALLVDLGPRIVRAETAAVAAIALCQARWGDLGTREEGPRTTE